MSKIKEREITVALSGCFVVIILLGYFIFPGPRSWPTICITGPGPQFVFTGPAPNLYLTALVPNFYLPALVSPEPGLAYTNLVPPICIYWPWPTIFITVL